MQVKLISYNIWHGKMWPKLLPWLKEQSPDILCLQEVTAYQQNWGQDKSIDLFEELRAELDMDGKLAIAWKRHDDPKSYQGCAILSRFPITHHQAHFLKGSLLTGDKFDYDWSKEPRVAIEATLDINQNPLTVITTHLSYYKHFQDKSDKLDQAKRLVEIVHNAKHPTILTGDLNSTPDSKTIKLLEQDFTNHTPNVPTFAKHRFEHDGFVVDDLFITLDYIFTKGVVDIQAVDIPNTDASDHLPLVVTINID